METIKSIKEKAKAYDRAVEQMRSLRDKLLNDGIIKEDGVVNSDFQRIFPELKESEDERIRKSIIGFLKTISSLRDEKTVSNKDFDSKELLIWAAWLEKRCKKSNNVYDKESSEILGRVIRRYINDPNIPYTEREKVSMEVIPYVERLEKQGEQNHTDKVKQKFKVGDWLVCGNYEPEQIIGIKTNAYEMSNGDIRPFHMIDNNHNIRLWTIQDAKDGDVLEYQGEIFIIRELKKKVIASRTIEYYCCYDGEHFINNSIYSLMDDDLVNIHPSTQEQHNLLLQKMKEAGYEWDAEKKELKKVVTPIFHIGNRVRYKGHKCDGIITEITDTDYICGNAKLPISSQDNLELVERNPAWSKKDNSYYDDICEILINLLHSETADVNKDAIQKDLDWFISLEERVQPQPKQEWSEEDEKMIGNIRRIIEQDAFSNYAVDVDGDFCEKAYIDAENWLKSIKDRVQPNQE